MARVAVIHEDTSDVGGAEGVLAHTLQAIQSDHSVTLFTLRESSIDEVNETFGTDVDSGQIEVINPVPSVLCWLFESLESVVVKVRSKKKLKSISISFLKYWVLKRQSPHDVYVCTQNEFATEEHSVEYVHFPSLSGIVSDFEDRGRFQTAVEMLNRYFHDVPDGYHDNTTTITNSDWTADIIERAYGIDPLVIYPPVDHKAFDPVPWNERDNEIVAIGRIVPGKRYEEMIEVMDGLSERIEDVSFRIVGSSRETAYYSKIARMASDRPYVSLETDASRDDLCSLLESCKLGVHGKKNEHFGMAVAEMRAAGMLPLVHGSGGQVEIVENRPELIYETWDDLVSRIDDLLGDEDKQRRLREAIVEGEFPYSADRFRRRMKDQIELQIDDCG
jgi:glycosyltransferase involved in cell wall biosynthesis